MRLAAEGAREMALATFLMAGLASVAVWLFWPAVVVPIAAWAWVVWFFRDPRRVPTLKPGELCSAADGTVTEICDLQHHESIGGAAVRIGVFLSLFDVHINRSPCGGRVRSLSYRRGEFLDARHPESGRRNESNRLLIDPDAPMPGPVEVRQVAGLVARRIICHAGEGERLEAGGRFGLIKFGSRTEVVIPRLLETEITVKLGDKVRAGLTVMARQPDVSSGGGTRSCSGSQAKEPSLAIPEGG